MKTEPVSPPSDKFAIAISVPLVFEYEDAVKRLEFSAITEQDIGDFIDFLCEIGHHQEIESYLKFIQYAVNAFRPISSAAPLWVNWLMP